MIQANELRLGVWVYDIDKNPKQMEYGDFVALGATRLHFSPIPITPEILKQCGYAKYGNYPMYKRRKKRESGYGLRYEELTVNDINEDGKEFGTMCNAQWIELKYLHQFQNLYFALTGKELQINLNVATSI